MDQFYSLAAVPRSKHNILLSILPGRTCRICFASFWKVVSNLPQFKCGISYTTRDCYLVLSHKFSDSKLLHD